jgi:hypothetical protein
MAGLPVPGFCRGGIWYRPVYQGTTVDYIVDDIDSGADTNVEFEEYIRLSVEEVQCFVDSDSSRSLASYLFRAHRVLSGRRTERYLALRDRERFHVRLGQPVLERFQRAEAFDNVG